MVKLLLLLALLGCASTQTYAANEELRVQVTNDNFYGATIFISNHQVGSVKGNQQRTFVVPLTQLPASRQVTFSAYFRDVDKRIVLPATQYQPFMRIVLMPGFTGSMAW